MRVLLPPLLFVAFLLTLFLGEPRLKATRALGDAEAYRVGLVFDVGGLGDKSFNDGAYEGLVRAQKELGVEMTALEPGDGAGRAAALRMLASSHHALVIGVGFVFTDDLLQVAADYPDVHFVGIDFSLAEIPETEAAKPLKRNLCGVRFREEEGSYLAGAFAAMVSTTHSLGFVGGMDIPLIHRFSAGFRQGAVAVCPTCEVRTLFAGLTPSAFKDPGRGREIALSLYGGGADIVFHAAGATGLGVFQAARQTHHLVVGVDSDQQAEAPDVVLTSMVKRIAPVVFALVQESSAGTWRSGIRQFGLAEDGLALAINDTNRHFFTAERSAQLDELRQKIIAKQIRIADHD